MLSFVLMVFTTFKRDREPTRIPVRTLKRLKNKSRKLRQYIYDVIRSNIHKSSKIHSYISCKRVKSSQYYTMLNWKIAKRRLMFRDT